MASSDLIAIAAFLVSGLAAIYTERMSREAKKANAIALHSKKVAIYEEVISFSDCFRGLFSVPTYKRLQQFRKRAVHRAEIYLSAEAYEQLKRVYEHCAEQEVWLSIATSEGNGGADKPSELEVRQKYKSVLDLLYPALDLVRHEARIDCT